MTIATAEPSVQPQASGVLPLAIAFVYCVAGIALYANILSTYFVADDFSYIDAIQRAHSPSVIFSALAERYFRPMVVLVYYLNYQLSGLNPWSYHLTVVLINAVNAWLVFTFARTVDRESGLFVPFLAGALFLVFGGHAEAVTWIGGMADPLVTLFALTVLIFFLRALESSSPVPHLFGAWIAFAAALLSKESAAIVPAVCVIAAWLRQRSAEPRPWRVVAVALAGCAITLAAYVLLRRSVLGFSLVNLAGLGTNTDPVNMGRIFLLRSFIPQGTVLSAVWEGNLDLYVLWPLVALLAWRVPAEGWRVLVIFVVCVAAALAPVLPLSIAVATPESERLIYMASAFACLLVVWLLGATIRRPAIVAAIVCVMAAGHVLALVRINRNWQEASEITRRSLASFADTLRGHEHAGSGLTVLNVADNVRGAYVFRRGFHEALRISAPHTYSAFASLDVMAVYAVSDIDTPVRVTRLGPRTLRADLGGGWLIGSPNPPSERVTLSEWGPQGFVMSFSPKADGDLVVYFTPSETNLLGRLPLD